jgi:RNA-binding protein
VTAPTNPKKKSLMPSSPLRRSLRAAGHHLSAIVQVGKEGVTDAVVRQLEEALLTHELVKVKVGTETPEDRFEASQALGDRAEAQIAQVLGRTILVYKRHPEKPRFEAAPAREAKAPVERKRARRKGPAQRAASRKPTEKKAPAEKAPRRFFNEKPPARKAAAGKPAGRKPFGGKPSSRKPFGGKPLSRKPLPGKAASRKSSAGKSASWKALVEKPRAAGRAPKRAPRR